MREVAIAGIGLAKFGRYDGKKGRPRKLYPELGSEAVTKALKYANMEWKEIEAAFGGTYYGGLGGTHQCVEKVGLTGIPLANISSGHSSEAALRLAYTRVGLGVHDIVLAVGAETLPAGPLDNLAMPVWMRMMGLDLLPAEAACSSVRYMEECGATVEDFAQECCSESECNVSKRGQHGRSSRLQNDLHATKPSNDLCQCGWSGSGHLLQQGQAKVEREGGNSRVHRSDKWDLWVHSFRRQS